MDIIAKYKLIAKLTRIVEDDASSDAEKKNAEQRIIEIKNKLNEYSVWLNIEQMIDRKLSRIKDKQIISIRKKSFKDKRSVLFFPTDLVFGWDKKVIIDVESIFDDINKVIFLEWKCPCCGGHVERIINQKHRARLLGKPDGIRNFINGIRQGKINQLCNECYERYR
jgi:hypothetical protein